MKRTAQPLSFNNRKALLRKISHRCVEAIKGRKNAQSYPTISAALLELDEAVANVQDSADGFDLVVNRSYHAGKLNHTELDSTLCSMTQLDFPPDSNGTAIQNGTRQASIRVLLGEIEMLAEGHKAGESSNLYSVFDVFLGNPTWHSGLTSDRIAFYQALNRIVDVVSFNVGSMSDYIKHKYDDGSIGKNPDHESAVQDLAHCAHAVSQFLHINQR